MQSPWRRPLLRRSGAGWFGYCVVDQVLGTTNQTLIQRVVSISFDQAEFICRCHSPQSFLNERLRSKAKFRSNRALNAGWSVISLYERPAIRRLIQPLASRGRSGSASSWPSWLNPRWPFSELAAAINQDSYSRLASTTLRRWWAITFLLRCRMRAPSSAGQSSSASSKTKIQPETPHLLLASNNWRRNSSSLLRNRSRRTRIGGSTSSHLPGVYWAPMRRSSTGSAATSPSPSTMQAIDVTLQRRTGLADALPGPPVAACPVPTGSV